MRPLTANHPPLAVPDADPAQHKNAGADHWPNALTPCAV